MWADQAGRVSGSGEMRVGYITGLRFRMHTPGQHEEACACGAVRGLS